MLKAYPDAQAVAQAGVEEVYRVLRSVPAAHFGRPTAKKLVLAAQTSISSGRALTGRASSLRILCDQLEHTQANLNRLEGSELRKNLSNRKVDKCGTVCSYSHVPRYRRSWGIGAVFAGMQRPTLPITLSRGKETGPILRVSGTVQLSFLKTVPHLSTLRLQARYLNAGPMSEQQEQPVAPSMPQYISMDDAARELNVNRSTVYYYLEQLEIKPTKFPLDRRAYIALVDLERIKAAKKSAAEGRH